MLTGIHTPRKKTSWKSIMGFITGGSFLLAPMCMGKHESVNTTYRDPDGRLAICFGHREGVKPGDKATDEQCQTYLETDVIKASTAVLERNPSLTKNPNAYQAAVLFAVRERIDIYTASDMALAFDTEDWVKGCRAFRTASIYRSYKNRNPAWECYQTPNKSWNCKIPELVKARQKEYTICIGKG